MKVLILSDARSVHTKRWVSALAGRGVDVVLYSINMAEDEFFSSLGIKAYYFDLFTYKNGSKSARGGALRRHFEAVRDLRRVLSVEKPDILHAHFLTSYSLIAALAGFHPLIVSMWGTDVYEFPQKSLVNRLSVEYIMCRADKILSTSNVMARHAKKYTSKDIVITPFGVDTDLFHKIPEAAPAAGKFVLGTVKTLAVKYGIDYLIKAFDEVVRANPSLDCSLEIYGKGPQEHDLKQMVSDYGLQEKVRFKGYVDNSLLAGVYSSFSVSAFLSVWDSESFGVAAVEAMSCECGVVVSDADGFCEVVESGVTGVIVPKYDYHAAAKAIQRFIDDPSLSGRMGSAGRNRVKKLYEWKDNVDTMISVYNGILSHD